MKMGARLVDVGGLVVGVWLHSRSDPSAMEWTATCRNVADKVRDKQALARFRAFIVTDGGTPDALQRKALYQDALGGYPARVAVVSESVGASPLKRGIATALSWMNPNLRVFEPKNLTAALDHVGLETSAFGPIWACLESIQSSLGANTTMRLLAQELNASKTPSVEPGACLEYAGAGADPGRRPSRLPPVSLRMRTADVTDEGHAALGSGSRTRAAESRGEDAPVRQIEAAGPATPRRRH